LATRALRQGDTGEDVKALQQALNVVGEPRFHPPLGVDKVFGPATLHAYQALGFALGFTEQTLATPQISPRIQNLILHPDQRDAKQLQRGKRRRAQLQSRTIAFDGVPTYWGIAKPLLLAREHGWSGRLDSSDRRPGVAEKFGHSSQVTLFSCFQRQLTLGRCPPDCHGNCSPANRPGSSSHEQLSDAKAFKGPVGRQLRWWELGIDVTESDALLEILGHLGYHVRRTYPDNPPEHHHLNLTANPGPVLAPDGAPAHAHAALKLSIPRAAMRAAGPAKAAKAAKAGGATVTLTGPDVSLNQPSVDWGKVKAAGHTFAIAKVSDGLGTPDKAFGKARWKQMKDAGLVRGAYHFGRPQRGRDPKKEVAEFLRLIKAAGGLQPGDLLPILDLEKFGSAGRLTAAQTLEWARGWVTEMRKRFGRRPIIYTGAFWRETMGNPADNLGCPLWLAAYVKQSELAQFVPVAWRSHGHALWQHTDKGKCGGIPKPCDLSKFMGTREEFNRLRL
jgi:lysozyme